MAWVRHQRLQAWSRGNSHAPPKLGLPSTPSEGFKGWLGFAHFRRLRGLASMTKAPAGCGSLASRQCIRLGRVVSIVGVYCPGCQVPEGLCEVSVFIFCRQPRTVQGCLRRLTSPSVGSCFGAFYLLAAFHSGEISDSPVAGEVYEQSLVRFRVTLHLSANMQWERGLRGCPPSKMRIVEPSVCKAGLASRLKLVLKPSQT